MVLIPLMAFTLAQALNDSPATGTFLLRGQPINRIKVNLVEYVGDCPGWGSDRVGGLTFLANIKTAPYRRILITNQSTGGYTDREYDERRTTSEPFDVASGQGHYGGFLTLAPGLNEFSYVVRQSRPRQQVGVGTATLLVQEERFTRFRSFSKISVDQYCLMSRSRDLSRCDYRLTTVERTGVCPDGQRRILSQETVRLKS